MAIWDLFQQNGTTSASTSHTKKKKAARGTPLTRILWSLLVTAIFAGLYFYFALPALNVHNPEFYWFLFWICIVFSAVMIFLSGFRGSATEYVRYTKRTLKVPFWIIVALAAVCLIGAASGWVVFRAADYSDLLKTETGDFSAEVAEISWDQIPLLDEDSANNLANRKLGELSELVSQFTVSPSSAQINYNNAPVRVTYLNYGGIFKWWNNRQNGIPAYLLIDMRTQQVDVVRLDEGIKYSPSEYLNRDLMRKLRFSYPTLMFGDVNFEIDDDGTPYWVASVVKKTIGLFGGEDVQGAVLLNAQTGESQYCDIEDVPTWVDRVYPASLVISQYNYYGKYHNGFWNSLFSQTNCTVTTDGYNYIALDDDVWVYTGITSVTGDRGNIGFILVNQRTKEAKYYACPGAEEHSARSSAEGAVQQFSYQATFPLLLNISEQPTYFMALKDEAGLVKMYAMVNVQQYQLVATGSSVSECQQNYHKLLVESGIVDAEDLGQTEDEPEQTPQTASVSGTITDIRSASIDGNTIFYLQLDGSDVYYTVSAKDYPIAAILNTGDQLTISYLPGDGPLLEVKTLERNSAPAAEDTPAEETPA